MAKFNLKEHIAKNKATFFGSLTEGQFSWMTQDTGQQIGSQEGNTIPVYMFDDKGKYWYEPSYDGYGVFGGMDYYKLLDQMNGGRGDRNEGVRKAFDPTLEGKLLFPALVVSPNNFNYKTHDFTKEAETDPDQSWLPYEEDNNKYDDYDYGRDGFGDMDTPENYDEEDDMMEGYDEFKRVEKGKKKTVAKDKGEEDVYGAGVKKGEEIEKKKLKKEGMFAPSVNSFSEWLEGVKNIPKVANDFRKYPKLANAKSKEEFIKIVQDLGELYDESETKTEYHLGDTIYVSKYPITGIERISLSSSLSSHGYYTDETDNMVSNETPEQARNRVYPPGSRMDENKTTTKMKKSDLKAKIKEMIVAEMELDVQDTAKEASEYDFLAELENMLNEAEGLTPLQDYVYQYEIEISGEDRAQEFLDDIKKLNTPQDVYDYYAYDRDWSGSDLNNIFRQVKRKFANLITSDDLTPLQRRAYSYTKERFGNDEAKKSLDQIKTLKTSQEFTDWVKKKIEAENSLNEASEFDTNKPARIAEFIKALDALVDEYHAELYLSDDLFNAVEMVKRAANEAINLNEAEGDTEKDTAETDTETTTDTTTDTETTDVTTTAEVDPNVKAVQDSLTQAQAAAQQLGDAKLLDQIGNTITFFTRTHVVEKPGTVAESIFPMLKKILK